jgi:hypothetical protein
VIPLTYSQHLREVVVMGHGPGWLQRCILAELDGAGWKDIRWLGARCYSGSEKLSEAQLESLRRSVRSLTRRGLVETMRDDRLGLRGMPLQVRLTKAGRTWLAR